MIKISEIFAHARTKSFSVHGPDVLIERVIVDQFEVEATVTPPSSTLRKLEPEQNRHLSKKKYFAPFEEKAKNTNLWAIK